MGQKSDNKSSEIGIENATALAIELPEGKWRRTAFDNKAIGVSNRGQEKQIDFTLKGSSFSDDAAGTSRIPWGAGPRHDS